MTNIFPGGLFNINSWVIFRDLDIPQNVTINKAFIRFTAKSDDDNATTAVNLMICGQDVDSGSAPTYIDDVLAMPRTTSQINWDNLESWTADSTYDTVDISCVIQEIIDRPGWVLGNSITLFIEDYDSGGTGLVHTRTAYDLVSDPDKAPELILWWSITEVATGGILFGGVNVPALTVTNVSSGGIKFGGTNEPVLGYLTPSSGGLIFGGENEPFLAYIEESSGGLIFGGSNTPVVGIFPGSSGGIKFGGFGWKYKRKLTIPASTTVTDLPRFTAVFKIQVDPTEVTSNKFFIWDENKKLLGCQLRSYEDGQFIIAVQVDIVKSVDTVCWFYYGKE